MRTIGNFLWFILGGVLMGLGWWLVGLVCFLTIVGIPWGKACFVIGQFSFFPFGKEAVTLWRQHPVKTDQKLKLIRFFRTLTQQQIDFLGMSYDLQ